MEWFDNLLKDLDEEKAKAIKSAFDKEFPKNAVPKDQYNKKIDEYDSLKNQYDETEAKITSLQKTAETSETVKADLEKITAEFEEYKANATKRESNRVKLEKVKTGLSKKFNPDAIDLLLSTFEADELIENEAGEIVDLDSKLNKLAEAKPGLVLKTDVGTGTPPSGKTPNSDPDFSKMTDEEYFKYKSEHKGD